MATYEHIEDPKEKIQKIMDGLGAVQGVNYAFLVTNTGSSIMVAQTTPMSEELMDEISVLVTDILSTTIELSPKLGMDETNDFIHIKTPLGLGLVSQVESAILVLITSPKVKLGLMHCLITSTKTKISKVRDMESFFRVKNQRPPSELQLKKTLRYLNYYGQLLLTWPPKYSRFKTLDHWLTPTDGTSN